MAERAPPSPRQKPDYHEIARLNGWLRANLTSPGSNRVVMTAGIAELIGDVALFRGFRKRAELVRIIRDFHAFDLDDDPHGHRDLGVFRFEEVSCLWKIDFYDRDLAFGSDDTANSLKTVRVLTILLADEYQTPLPRRSAAGASFSSDIGEDPDLRCPPCREPHGSGPSR